MVRSLLALGNGALACSPLLALPDRIPDYDKKCNIIAVQISRSDRFCLGLKHHFSEAPYLSQAGISP